MNMFFGFKNMKLEFVTVGLIVVETFQSHL